MYNTSGYKSYIKKYSKETLQINKNKFLKYVQVICRNVEKENRNENQRKQIENKNLNGT